MKSGFDKAFSSLANIIGVVLLLSGLVTLFTPILGVDMDIFSDIKCYFQTPCERRDNTPSKEREYEIYKVPLDLNLAIDYYSTSHTNDVNRVTQMRAVVNAYTKCHASLTPIYGSIEKHNRLLAIGAAVTLFILAFIIIWLAIRLGYATEKIATKTMKSSARNAANSAKPASNKNSNTTIQQDGHNNNIIVMK